MKTCKACGESKSIDDFQRNKNCLDGRLNQCKECVAVRKREYNSRPEVKARKTKYDADYYATNREAILAQNREYRNRPGGKERRAELHAAYYAENRDALLAYQSEHRASRPHIRWEYWFKHRARKYGYEHLVDSMESFTKADVIEKYGNQCWHCKTGPFEQLDHYPVPVVRGGAHVLENCRPSCTPCNRRSWRSESA